jgi:tetratricopeptide (TPR) repeat protein
VAAPRNPPDRWNLGKDSPWTNNRENPVVVRWLIAALLACGGGVGVVVLADTSTTSNPAPKGTSPEHPGEVELVENVLKARKDYWTSLDKLRQHYVSVNDIERAKWVEEELKSYHRMMKYSYRLDVKDVPPPTLTPKKNVVEANNLFRRAVEYKGRGAGEEYVDNQRRAEILLQAILEKHPESDKIADAAYHLGEIYEQYRPRPQYERAAAYFERSYQWNKASATDARLRAARLYDHQLRMLDRAKEGYRGVMNHDTNPERVAEAERRLTELSGGTPAPRKK